MGASPKSEWRRLQTVPGEVRWVYDSSLKVECRVFVYTRAPNANSALNHLEQLVEMEGARFRLVGRAYDGRPVNAKVLFDIRQQNQNRFHTPFGYTADDQFYNPDRTLVTVAGLPLRDWVLQQAATSKSLGEIIKRFPIPGGFVGRLFAQPKSRFDDMVEMCATYIAHEISVALGGQLIPLRGPLGL